jgi:hypothetical protein
MSNIEEPKIDKYNNVFIHYNHNSKVVFHIMCTAGESVHAEIYDVSGKSYSYIIA